MAHFLTQIGMKQHVPIFEREEVDMAMIRVAEVEDLDDLIPAEDAQRLVSFVREYCVPHPDDAPAPAVPEEVDPDSNLCVVCWDADKATTFLHGDTAHIACCIPCAQEIKDAGDPCPICRAPLDTVLFSVLRTVSEAAL